MVGKNWNGACAGGGGAVYGLGLIGALIYFIQQAGNPTEVIIGILKSIVWPAFLVYEALKRLGLQP